MPDARSYSKLLAEMPQTVATKLIGLARTTLRESDAPKNSDGSYDAFKLVAWAIERAKQSASDDPLLASGGDSPNLERYRKAKAELAEMDAAERRGQIVDVSALIEWWNIEVAPHIRQAIDEIDRLSADAANVIRTAIEKANTTVEKRQPADRDDDRDAE